MLTLSGILSLPSRSHIAMLTFLISLCLTVTAHALAINAPAPAFTLSNLDGKQVSLSDFKGKVVILKLGTTWCPGCRDQTRELQKLDTFIRDKGIILIDIFLDDPENTIRAYQKDYPMETKVVTLLGDQKVTRSYGVYAIPRLLILSPEQLIISDTTGMTARQIKARILQATIEIKKQ